MIKTSLSTLCTPLSLGQIISNTNEKICSWKKYILLNKCRQIRGYKFFEIVHWLFKLPPYQHQLPGHQARFNGASHVRLANKRTINDFKNSFLLILSLFMGQNMISRNLFWHKYLKLIWPRVHYPWIYKIPSIIRVRLIWVLWGQEHPQFLRKAPLHP